MYDVHQLLLVLGLNTVSSIITYSNITCITYEVDELVLVLGSNTICSISTYRINTCTTSDIYQLVNRKEQYTQSGVSTMP